VAIEFWAVGRIPLKQGWKAAYGATEPEPKTSKEGDTEAEQRLPQLIDGEHNVAKVLELSGRVANLGGGEGASDFFRLFKAVFSSRPHELHDGMMPITELGATL
jgi:hypothetical protein